jgi:hypothetical protein
MLPAIAGPGNTGSRLPKIPTSMQINQELKQAIHKIIFSNFEKIKVIFYFHLSHTKIFLFLFISFSVLVLAAVRVKSTDDDVLKYQIYNTNSKVVVNYSMKDFDALFFEFSDKKMTLNFL